ncbi:hypothetical protein COY17_03725 [Candidatus Saccharibacteria bacterium CG_4_10_14_0_2_um_filter_52_9]|nr:MAG: hypothetical protein COY17_03725 [Candidatus Saccharibacteria bacterium CG_4_10_14_0_2_um_filter_52_9]
MWELFLGFHLVGLSGYNLVLRRALINNIDRWTLATIMATATILPLWFIRPFVHVSASYNRNSLLLILASLVLGIGLHLSNVKALQYLEASVYSVLYNLRILFTTILGIVFLNEDIVPLQIAGGLLIFLAVVIVRQKGDRSLTRRGIEWGITASIVISLLNLVEKELLHLVGYFAYTVPAWTGSVIVMWAIMLLRNRNFSMAIFKNRQIQTLMLFRTISANSFVLTFYYGGKLSVSSYISSLSVIITVLLGIVLLGEKDYLKQKLAAVGVAVAGLTCILLTRLL